MGKSKIIIVLGFGVAALLCATCASPPVEMEESPTRAVAPTEAERERTDFVNPIFNNFPPPYRTILLPTRIDEVINDGGVVVELPSRGVKDYADMILWERGYDDQTVNHDLLVTFPRDFSIDGNQEPRFIAAPTTENYEEVEFREGVFAGVLLDIDGGLVSQPESYEVVMFENSIELIDSAGQVLTFHEEEENYFPIPQRQITVERDEYTSVAFFVQNGCWLCWKIDKRCGCLICK